MNLIVVCRMILRQIISHREKLTTNDVTDNTLKQTMYVIRWSSIYNIFANIVKLARNSIEGSSELVLSIFTDILAFIKEEHEVEIYTYVSNILFVCIIENRKLPKELMVILLTPLLPGSKQTSCK